MNRVLASLLTLALVGAGPANPPETRREVTEAETRELAAAALSPEARRLPGLDFEIGVNPAFPHYRFVMVTWGVARGEAGGNVIQLAIDTTTAEVWSGLVCREVTSRDLRALQVRIRKSLGLTDEMYRKLRRRGPMC